MAHFLVWRLAVRDIVHDWRPSAALTLTVVSVLAPLLVLFGLKTGVVTTLREIVVKDPRNLEVIIFENTSLPLEWFDAVRANRPEVRFLIPRTRTLNTIVDVRGPNTDLLKSVDILPTAEDDPLVPQRLGMPQTNDEIVVTQAVAERLRVDKGMEIQLLLKRVLPTGEEGHQVPLRVIGVVPESSYARPAIFATLGLLASVEDYREGYRVAGFGASSGTERIDPRSSFAGARLYARGPEDVAPLARMMRELGLDVRTRSEDLGRLRAAESFLGRVLFAMAAVSLVGGYLAFGGAIWIAIERKRHSLALLRLLGFRRRGVLAFCLAQGGVLGSLAFAISLVLFLLGAALLNNFGSAPLLALLGADTDSASVCSLGLRELIAAALGTVCFSILASSLGAAHATAFAPAESLREA